MKTFTTCQFDDLSPDMFGSLPQHAQREILLKAAGGILVDDIYIFFEYFFTMTLYIY